MIKLFKILLDNWKVIIDVYRELFTSDQMNIQSGGQSNTATLETVKKAKECFEKINPGEMVLTKQNQSDIRVYIAPDSIILHDDQECIIFTPAGGKL